MSDIKINVGLNSSAAKQGLSDLKTAIGGVGNATNAVTGAFVKLAAAAGAVIAVGKSLQGIATAGAKFEKLQNSLNVVFGSVERGTKALEMARTIADNTGMSMDMLAESMIQLKGAGVEPTVQQLTAFADAAAVSKDAAGAFEAAISLVSRTTAGGLGLEELERLGDRGIPVYDILNEKLGITRLQISDIGKTAEGAQRIINALTEGLEERFGGAALANAQTFDGVMNQLNNSLDVFKTRLFNLGLGDFFKESALGVKTFFDTLLESLGTNQEGLGIFLDNVRETIGNVIKTLVLGAAALYDTFAPALEGIFNFLKTAINNLISFANMLPPEFKSMGIIGFMMLGARGKGLVLVIAGLFDDIIKYVSLAINKMEPVINKTIEWVNKLIELDNKINDTIEKITGLRAYGPLQLIEPIKAEDFTFESIRSALSDTISSLFGEMDALPLIGESGTISAEQRATDFFNRFSELYQANLDKMRNNPIPLPTPGGDEPETVVNPFVQAFTNGFNTLRDQVNDTASYGKRLFDEMTNGWSNAFVKFAETGKLSFKDLFKSIMAEIIKMQANKLFLALFNPASAAGGAGLITSLFSGFFANGGFIPSGKFGIAGESGPEIVSGPARVTSTADTEAMLGGQTYVTYNINAIDSRSFKETLSQDPEFIYNLTRYGSRRYV